MLKRPNWVLLSILMLTACSSSGQPNEEEAANKSQHVTTGQGQSNLRASDQDESPLQYDIVDRDTYDTPMKSQVFLHAVVNGQFTEPGLKRTLDHLYSEAVNAGGFEYHDRPTHVAIYLYTSEEHYKSGMGQWIAMRSRIGQDADVETKIKPELIEQASRPAEERYGLTESARMELFGAIVRAEDRAWERAESMYPLPDPSQAGYSQAQARRQAEKQGEAVNRLTEEYKSSLAADYDLTPEQLKQIGLEGMEKNWPMP